MAEIEPAESVGKVISLPQTLTAQQILNTEYPDLIWTVPGLIPEGLTILASRPKIGKSWLCLGLAVGVASGGMVLGQIEVQPHKVLYIAMEDTERRLQSRLQMILPGNAAPDQLIFALTWPRLGGPGEKKLRAWMTENPETKLIIIDTLAGIRGSRRPGSLYDADYREIAGIKGIADEYGISIIVVHHSRKAKAEDILDRVSGSTGLTGAADNVAILMRERSQADATLFVSGREVEDQELALNFEAGSWVIMGEAQEYRLTEERREIVDLLRREGGPIKLADIAGALGKKKPNVINLLNSLIEEGFVEKAGHGKYQLKTASSESGEPDELAA